MNWVDWILASAIAGFAVLFVWEVYRQEARMAALKRAQEKELDALISKRMAELTATFARLNATFAELNAANLRILAARAAR